MHLWKVLHIALVASSLVDVESGGTPQLTNQPRDTQATGAAASTPATSTTPNPLGTQDCWTLPECEDTFRLVQGCYTTIGGLIDPNDLGQSQAYQECFCDPNAPGDPKNVTDGWRPCYSCYQQGGTDLSILNSLDQDLHNFCGTHDPSLYLFLLGILDFLSRAHAPSTFTVLSSAITKITTLSSLFTPASGLNSLPSTSAAPATASTTNPQPLSHSGPGQTQPHPASFAQTQTRPPSNTPNSSRNGDRTSTFISGTVTIVYITHYIEHIPPATIPASLSWPWGPPPRYAGQRQTTTLTNPAGENYLVVVGPEETWRPGLAKGGGGRVGSGGGLVGGRVQGREWKEEGWRLRVWVGVGVGVAAALVVREAVEWVGWLLREGGLI
ncbi:hypothetical protein K432DRAFT_423737 [Lepidopterella palustris CBS 459.81]|uniref:Uncharacterized protein n=1 Tax=Lepidopterella palustris CBS 459.81 TaxID=1314670 RepID=A0A8E2EFE3_9PEZI|nr:hypothetical protein K432DRAFT_423737 [Lepidopterella palustris CBS 459.81]